jgi:hypothetical protein
MNTTDFENELLPYNSFEELVNELNKISYKRGYFILHIIKNYFKNIPDIRFRYVCKSLTVGVLETDCKHPNISPSCSIEIYTNYNIYVIINDLYELEIDFNSFKTISYNLNHPCINGHINEIHLNDAKIDKIPRHYTRGRYINSNYLLLEQMNQLEFKYVKNNIVCTKYFNHSDSNNTINELIKYFNEQIKPIELEKGILPIVYADYLKSLVYTNNYVKLKNYFMQINNCVLEEAKLKIIELTNKKDELEKDYIEKIESLKKDNEELLNKKNYLEDKSNNLENEMLHFMKENKQLKLQLEVETDLSEKLQMRLDNC